MRSADGGRRDGDAPIDAATGLPDGSSFDGAAGLRTLLAEQPRPVRRAVTEKLLTYALGRGVEYYDRPAVRQIVREAQARRLPLVVARSRHRQEHAVSDAKGVRIMIVTTDDHHQEASAAPDVPARHRRHAGAAAARQHGSGVRRRSARAPPAPIRRLGIVYVPNGIFMKQLDAGGDAAGLEITPILEPLAPFRDRMILVSGLSNKQGDALPGEGAGDHARAAGAYLTGVHPKKTEGADIRAGVSMDQIAAERARRRTPSSRRWSCRWSRASRWAPAIRATAAPMPTRCRWRSPTTPLPMENDPRVVFERLFGAQREHRSGGRGARGATRTAASSMR